MVRDEAVAVVDNELGTATELEDVSLVFEFVASEIVLGFEVGVELEVVTLSVDVEEIAEVDTADSDVMEVEVISLVVKVVEI